MLSFFIPLNELLQSSAIRCHRNMSIEWVYSKPHNLQYSVVHHSPIQVALKYFPSNTGIEKNVRTSAFHFH